MKIVTGAEAFQFKSTRFRNSCKFSCTSGSMYPRGYGSRALRTHMGRLQVVFLFPPFRDRYFCDLTRRRSSYSDPSSNHHAINQISFTFYFQGLNAILFNKNVDTKTYISLVPTSAHTGDGMGDLIALIVKLCETKLAQRLSYSEELQCTVLEVCLNCSLHNMCNECFFLCYSECIPIPGRLKS